MPKTIFRLALVACTIAWVPLFSAAASAEGLLEAITAQNDERLPQPSPGYQAKKLLPVTSDVLFQTVLRIFDENRITPGVIDKENGRIVSDYVAGPTFSTAFGLLGSNSTRYKVNIFIVKISKSSSKINVVARIESSGSQIQSWRDVSADNRKVVSDIEDWMYEQIEQGVEAGRSKESGKRHE